MNKILMLAVLALLIMPVSASVRTIQIMNVSNGLIIDNYVAYDYPNDNPITSINIDDYYLDLYAYSQYSKARRVYFQVNVSRVDGIVTNSYLNLFEYSQKFDCEQDILFAIVNDSSGFNLTNLTWNTQPCSKSVGEIVSSGCENYTYVVDNYNDVELLNLTGFVNRGLDEFDGVLTFVIYFSNENNALYCLDRVIYYSSRYGSFTPVFTVVYQVPDNLSYTSNVTVLGQQVGGFLGGLQGLLSFLLGLIIVGVVGMFFYVVFTVVSGSVKRGFK